MWSSGSSTKNMSTGIAIREFKMTEGYGFADYLPYVDKHAVGALEAKPAGFTLSGVKPQDDKYSKGLPPRISPRLSAPCRSYTPAPASRRTSSTCLIRSRAAAASSASTGLRQSPNGCTRITCPIGSADGAASRLLSTPREPHCLRRCALVSVRCRRLRLPTSGRTSSAR